MKVLALSDSLAPWHSFWIRFGQYAGALPWPVQIGNDAAAIDALEAGDRLLLYRYALGWGDLATRLQQAHSRGVLIVADVDDYLWQAQGWSRERLLGCTRALRQCAVITCSTTPLLEQLRVMLPGAALVLMPNTAPKHDALPEPLGPEPPLRIGWSGAPWTRPADLALLMPLARWIAARPTQLRLVHVGHSEGRLSLAKALELDPTLVDTVPLQGHGTYLQALRFHIGLAPVSAGSFNTYKSPIKVLEYSQLGIPWLASDAQPYRDLCKQWHWPGRLCRTREDWIEQLQPLLDQQKRLQEGQALQALCRVQASYASGVARWSQLLESNPARLVSSSAA